MTQQNKLPRLLLTVILLTVVCASLFMPSVEGVEAKPLSQVATSVVISEFRTRGPNGAADEFIEIYNPTNSTVPIGNWQVRVLTGTGTEAVRATITAGTNLLPGQYYLIANSSVNGYSGSIAPNQTYTTGVIDTGGIAIFDSSNVRIDSVGLNPTAIYIETTSLASLTTDVNQSYERNIGGSSDSCEDANDNSTDFQLISPSNPQNFSTQRSLCGVATDLNITQSVNNPSQSVGLNVMFTITVSNAVGFDDATNVSIRDLLPAGLTYVSDDSSGAYNNGTGIWTVGTVVNGTSATLNITATVATSGPKVNIVEIWSADQFDIDSTPTNSITTEDDYASVTVTPPGPSPTLNITNVVNNPTPNIGDNVVFTINVNNSSGTNATGVSVSALLPSGLNFVSASSPSYNSGTGVWTIGNLSTGANTSLTITATVISSLPMTLTATVSAGGFSNSSANATVTPISSTQADLTLTQTWSRSTSSAGTAVLNITVTNQDPINAATNVQVRSILPTGLTYVSHTSGQSYNSSTGIWAVGTVLGGNNRSISINVRVSASGTSTDNFAEIWQADQFDPDSVPANGDTGEDDDASVEVLVADLSLTQTSDIAGSNAVFTFRVTNSGPDDATNITIDNTVIHQPISYIYISDAVTTGTYASATGIWTIPFLADGATATLVITTTVVAPNENWAEVNSVIEVDPDSLPNNNSRNEDDDAASPSADLNITKTILSPAPYQNSNLNSNVTFRITVTNSGFANATGVEVKDLLPTGLTYVSHTSGQTYNKSSGIWSIGNLPRNTSRTLDITAQVTTLGIRTNWAEVWKSAQSDPDSDPGDSSRTSDDDDSVTITSYRSIIINEIAWSGTAASGDDEWIELYNPSDTAITITDWTIRKNSCAGALYITLSGSVSKDGYFLLERDDNQTVSDISANQIYSAATLLDTGETLYLCDNLGNFIDTANQQGSGNSSNPWPQGADTQNRPSMERKNSSTETDSSWTTNDGITKNGLNANGGAIHGTPGKKNSGTTTTNTTPAAPTSTPAPLIDPRPIINEILARPGFDWNQDGRVDVFDEFIEIKNLTAIDITLNGWKLDKNNGEVTFALPNVKLKPNERIVFYSLETNLLLSDGGETIRLINPSGKIYDAYTYTVAKAEDKSFCRLPDGNVYNGWFEDCIPTPSQSNTREGTIPTSPDDNESSICNLPDTIPADFFFAECSGYGKNIWNPFYWGDLYRMFIESNTTKWETYFE